MEILLKVLKSTNDFYTKIEERIITITAFLLTLMTVVAVFNRYFLLKTMAWYEEIAIFIYMVLVYWGASNVAKDDAHLRVTILTDMLRGKVLIYLNLLIELSCLIISILGIYFAIKMSLIITMKTVALRIPYPIILLFSLTMGFFGLTLRYLYKFVGSLNKIKKCKEVTNND